MAELTQEQLDWLASKGLDADFGDQRSEEAVPDPQKMIEQSKRRLQELQKKYPDKDFSSIVTEDGADNLAPIPGTGDVAQDVTEEVRAADEVGDFTRRGFYEDLGKRPDLDFLTGLTATASDFVGGEVPTDAQVERQATRIKQGNYDKKAQELYESTGQPITERRYQSPLRTGEPSVEGAETGRVFKRWTTDDDGNVVIEERIRVPEPNSSAFGMMTKEGFNRLYETGLTLRGFLPGQDGEQLRRENPNYELSGAESLGADAVSVGVSAVAGGSLFRAGAGLLKGIDTSTDIGRRVLAASQSIGATVGEFVAARDGTTGIIIGPESIKSWAEKTGMDLSDEEAQDWSLAMDGLVVNGSLDVVLGMLGKLGSFGAKKVDAGRQWADRRYLREAVENGQAMNVLSYLDPDGIRDAGPRAALGNIKELGRILNDNKKIKLNIAGDEFAVAADTTRAVMASSEAYIRTTRQGQRSGMSSAEWEEYVKEQSAAMSSRMISLMQANQGNPIVRDAANRVTYRIGGAFEDAAALRLPAGAETVDQAAQDTATSLTDEARRQSDIATSNIDDIDRQMADLTRQQAEVVRNNPTIRTFLDEVGGGLSYDDSSFRQTLNNVITEDIYPEFKRAADEVDAAYAAIPSGTPIDGEALMEQFDNLTRGIELSDIPGNPASKTRSILKALGDKFEPEEIGVDNAGEPVFETAEEVALRVSDEVDFKELYEMKGRLSQLIDDNRKQPAIQRRLIELRKHITDGETGQLAFQKQLGGDAGQLAQEADETYKQFKNRFAPNKDMEQLSERMEFTRSREPTTPEGETPRGTTDMLVEGNSLLRQAVDEPSGAVFDDLVRAASSESAIKEPLADLYVAQAARQLRVALDTGDSDRVSAVMSTFEANRQRLQNVGAGDVLSRLDTAMAEIQDDTARMLDDSAGLQKQKTALEQRVKDAQYGVIGELIDTKSGAGPFKATSSARDKLSNLFTRPDSANWVEQLQVKINELPDAAARRAATQSLEAVALDIVGREVFGTSPTAMLSATDAATNLKSSAVSRLGADQATNYMKAISKVFGEGSPESQGILRSLSILSNTDIPQKLRVSQAGSDTMPRAASDPAISDAVSTGILLTAGYMNPTAALLRRLSASSVQDAGEATKNIAKDALARIIAEPDMFSSMIVNLQKGRREKATELATKIAAKPLARSLRFNVRTEDPEDRETRPIFPDRDMLELFGR